MRELFIKAPVINSPSEAIRGAHGWEQELCA